MLDRSFLIKSLLSLPAEKRSGAILSLSNEEAAAVLYDWETWARPEQLEPPGDWSVWLIQAGRGWGKSRTGAEWVKRHALKGTYGRFHLIARTASDVRDVVVEGESGILNISSPDFRPLWQPSKKRLTWPNGAVATTFSADEPDALRGPQCEALWADELASWHYPDAWDMALMGLRIGPKPRAIVTTTPRPTKIIKELIKDPSTVVRRGTTYDNRMNLASSFFTKIINRYSGTRMGRQELNGELLEDNPNALWNHALIDSLRVSVAPEMKRIVVAIDPSATGNEDSDEAGIIGAGLGVNGHGYVLADKSLTASPDKWGKVAIGLYELLHADRVIAEVNNGGEMVKFVLHTIDPNLPYKDVHASKGKLTRAEPVSALYEQGRIHHVGSFPTLEDQMCDYTRDTADSPDRMDSLVWSFTELFALDKADTTGIIGFYGREKEVLMEKLAAEERGERPSREKKEPSPIAKIYEEARKKFAEEREKITGKRGIWG